MAQLNESKEEYVSLRQWFAEKDWEIWDKQIEHDSKSGIFPPFRKENNLCESQDN